MGKLRNGKVASKDKTTGEIIKGGGKRAVDWIWRVCNIAIKSGFVPEDWRSIVIVSLYKGKEEIIE